MRRKVLFISIALPPKNDPECIQSGRYLYYLERKNIWDICTLTSASPTLFMPYDQSLEFYVENVNKRIEIKIPENKYINFLIRKINKSILERPDSKMFFHWQWKMVSRKIQHPDIIYSRSFPLSSAIMAFKLKQHYDVPWVMHLSDPWVESPLLDRENRNNSYHAKWEKRCFDLADIISFTNRRALDLYCVKYPSFEHKFRVFPNAYDPKDMPGDAVDPSLKNGINKLKIVYTGGLANTRTAEVFIEALEILNNRKLDSAEYLDVIFAGDMDSFNKNLFETNGLPFLRHIGLLTNAEAKRLQMGSDILLVIDSKIENKESNVFFPSKLLDYMIIKKFIMGITEPDSPTDTFIKNSNGVTFAFDEPEIIANWIEGILQKNISDMKVGTVDEFYSAKHQSDKLSELFKSLLD